MRPNILFLMNDEHRFDVLGCAGNQVVRTPFLDQLAETGLVFDNAYTPSPICIPSRQCLAMGQYPHTCNVRRYGEDLPPFSNTFADHFSRNGYLTVCAGKLHHMGRDQMQGWLRRIGDNTHVSPNFIDDYRADPVKPLPGCGKWSQRKEILRAGIGHGPNTHDTDAYALEGALRFIEQHFCDSYYDRPGAHQPLMLKVSFNRPHYAFLTSEERFAYYLNRVPVYADEPRFDHPVLGAEDLHVSTDSSLTERDLRRATAAYYGMVEETDADFARLGRALEAVGQNLDEWIVVFTADHGDMLGEHAAWEKQKFFEGSVRVPLMIRWPKGFAGGRRIPQNVSLCDLYATFCDLAALECPEGLDSRSLRPLLEGGNDLRWDNECLSHFGNGHLMIKRDELKYQCYGDDGPEVLFDLARDPLERINFVDDVRYASDLEKLRRRRDSLGYY
ncbi:sulfatase-like hydrolase/transferase [Puniceicoccus vermicola]|uniref:Sulfatase-like hydrolase/transferase n=1 Tax=Puniceicoccus vermicola TaxID=388746 RepID=A0A7X1AX16_9BACT|nr:sulfatase-like hydrolase/transferase [Puniceicoccus vermicola]MBC2601585.1 sulfatase-like hydrolase/transferase [Puniceicoccus vermicola]